MKKNNVHHVKLQDMHTQGATSAVHSCETFWASIGSTPDFLLFFNERIIPMSMFCLKVEGLPVFQFVTRYPMPKNAKPGPLLGLNIGIGHLGMSDTYGSDKHIMNVNGAFIKSIRAQPRHHWTGTHMIELGLAIARVLGVRRVRLHDGAIKKCNKSVRGFSLSLIMLLSRRESFYGRFGFKPIKAGATAELADLLNRISTCTVAGFVRYMTNMIKHLAIDFQAVPSIPLGAELVLNNKAKQHPHDMTKSQLNTRVKLMSRLVFALTPKAIQKKKLVMHLGDNKACTCQVLADFSALSSIGFLTLRFPQMAHKEVCWPPGLLIAHVAQINDMPLEARVQQDAAHQRVIS